jgi:hypothetical protein
VDVEITGFTTDEGIYVNAVLLNEEYRARRVAAFAVSVRCEKEPKAVLHLPEEEKIAYTYQDGYVTFEVESGDRMEFHVAGHEYGMLIEGDTGNLTFQGTRYLGFDRVSDFGDQSR